MRRARVHFPHPTSPPAFAGDPAAVLLVAEAYRLAHGHQFNAAFASETARIDPLPHQRIAVYERMLPREPLRFLLADDAGADETIGLCVREMLFRRRIRRVPIVPPAGLVGNPLYRQRGCRTLSSDKVFDVIGRLLENTSLREFMSDALTDEGERRALQRIERSVTETAVRDIVERQAKVYGAAGEVAPRLAGMRQELDRERYLHLLPAYVRLFVESAADKLGIGIHGDLDWVFSLEPVIPGCLDALLPALESYPPRFGNGFAYAGRKRERHASGCIPESRRSMRCALE